MRILVCHTQVPFARGGAELLVENLVAELRALGHETELVAVPLKWYTPSTVVTAVSVVDQDGRPVPLAWPGNSNPGGVFKYDSKTGTYQFNLKTTGYAAGRYTVYFRVGDDPTLHGLSFLIR